MVNVGNFDSRDQGMKALGILLAEGIEGTLGERPSKTFDLSDNRDGRYTLEVDLAEADEAARVLGPFLMKIREEAEETDRESAVKAGSSKVPIWSWLVIGITIIILIANQGQRFQRATGWSLDRQRSDRNGDDRPDEEFAYDSAGYFVEMLQDNNFDGRWDLKMSYDRAGQPATGEVDRNFDGFFEETIQYRFGVAVVSDLRETEGAPILRRFEYEHGIPAKELVDRDGDGVFEEVWVIDSMGNVERAEEEAP